MNVVIQETETGRFLQAPGLWTEDRRKAKIFPGSLQAIDYCHEHGLRRATIVIIGSEPRFEIRCCPGEPKSTPLSE